MVSASVVCSTHVEMFPDHDERTEEEVRLLHACGDVSIEAGDVAIDNAFAPRMWRCFQRQQAEKQGCHVCSTHVEMFLSIWPIHRAPMSLLHACGDVSYDRPEVKGEIKFTPRMWRCFCTFTL